MFGVGKRKGHHHGVTSAFGKVNLKRRGFKTVSAIPRTKLKRFKKLKVSKLY